MDWSPLLSGAVGGILAVLIGYGITRRSQPKLDTQSGRSVVRYHLVVRILGVLLTLLLVFATGLVIWTLPNDYDVQLALGAVTVLVGGYLLAEFFGVRIEFDATSLHRFAPWHRPRVVSWSEVSRVTYSSLASWHVIHSALCKIRVPDYMSGAKQVVDYAFERVEANKSMQPTREGTRG